MSGPGQSERRHLQDQSREAVLLAQVGGRATLDHRISVEFEASPAAAREARRALAAIERQIDPERLDDLRLLVSELVTNSVRHSGVDHGHNVVGLDVGVVRGTVRVDVTDRGSGFDAATRAPDQSQESGWGLYLVDRLADRWGVVRTPRTRVWFEIEPN